jgi:protein-S-isoprenylcysteine O-methyltransferase
MHALGKSYTRTLGTDERLAPITTGPYRVLRHPGYASSLPAWVGSAAGACWSRLL